MVFNKSTKIFLILIPILIIGGIFIYYKTPLSSVVYSKESKIILKEDLKENLKEEETVEEVPVVSHITTPEKVKAIYLSSWTAGTIKNRDILIKMIDETELNSVIIDIKDSTGKISFYIEDDFIKEIKSGENRIRGVDSLIELLHSRGIYVIGRISVFQDPYMTSKKPEWAITRLSDGGVWKDRKGLSFLDPANKEVRDYIISIAKASYDLGFDEINFDYIRYPSDGNMKDINYRLKEGKRREDNIEDFFIYLNSEMKKDNNIPISADLFGLTTESNNDMGIGQVWEKAIKHFDFLCPMVYPSHYPAGHMGYKNPSLYPYEVINQALVSAIKKTEMVGENKDKIRPWLQDFDLGTIYTKDLVRAQIKATEDNGLDSWMMWDPRNTYTPSAFLPEKKS